MQPLVCGTVPVGYKIQTFCLGYFIASFLYLFWYISYNVYDGIG